MARGGARPGAGKPKGRVSELTLEKNAVKKAFDQRVLQCANQLFTSQYALAIGTVYVIRVDEIEDSKGNIKKVHVLVEDIEEILQVLNETDGEGGTVEDKFYFVQTNKPDNKAIDSLYDRVFGKATNHIEVSQVKPELQIALDEYKKLINSGIAQDEALRDVIAVFEKVGAPVTEQEILQAELVQ